MKPTWIYERGVFLTEEQPEADEQFVAALQKHNLEVLEFDKNLIAFPVAALIVSSISYLLWLSLFTDLNKVLLNVR